VQVGGWLADKGWRSSSSTFFLWEGWFIEVSKGLHESHSDQNQCRPQQDVVSSAAFQVNWHSVIFLKLEIQSLVYLILKRETGAQVGIYINNERRMANLELNHFLPQSLRDRPIPRCSCLQCHFLNWNWGHFESRIVDYWLRFGEWSQTLKDTNWVILTILISHLMTIERTGWITKMAHRKSLI